MYCYSSPTFYITNVNNEIKNSSINPYISYFQNDGETIKNFQFMLYDNNKVMIDSSPVYYSLENDNYSFHSMVNASIYYIRAVAETTHGMVLDTGYTEFVTNFVVIPATTIFSLENNYNGGYVFSHWALNSVNGDSYSPNSSLILNKNATMYAMWIGTPYYVKFTDYPLQLVESTGEWEMKTESTRYYISALKDSGSGSYGHVTALTTLPTQGCNKVRVKYTHYSGYEDQKASINDVLFSIGSGYLNFNCSGDTFTLKMSVSEPTAYFTADVSVTEIYFYNE